MDACALYHATTTRNSFSQRRQLLACLLVFSDGIGGTYGTNGTNGTGTNGTNGTR
jgi:hypothetical protein